MNTGTILFVDDEVNILSSLRRALVDEEYDCIFASSGKDALQAIKNNEISVIVTDMRMPEMDGLTLLKEVKKISPDTVKIVLSGYTQLQQILTTINQGEIFKFITKPWKLNEEFKVIMNQAIEYYNLKKQSENLKKSLEIKNLSYQNMINGFEEKLSLYKNEKNITSKTSKIIIEHFINLFDNIVYRDDDNLDITFEKDFYESYKNNPNLENEDIEASILLDDFIGFSLEYFSRGNIKKEYKFIENYSVKTSKYIFNYFLKYILMIVVDKDENFNMKIIGNVKLDVIEFIFDIEILNGTEVNKNKSKRLIKQKRLEFIGSIINEYLKMYNGSFKFGEVQDRILVKLDLISRINK